jgi:hypothetical protein
LFKKWKYDSQPGFFSPRRDAKLAWFDKPVLSEPFILREPQACPEL